jgi:hypothetical protein
MWAWKTVLGGLVGLAVVTAGTGVASAKHQRTDAPLVVDGQLELVKKKRSSSSSSDGPREGIFDYIKDSFPLEMPNLSDDVEDQKVLYWILGSLLAGVGGHIWMPLILWGDCPSNDARQSALILGIVATALFWFPGVVPFLFPFIYLWGLGLIAFLVWWALVDGYLMPKAILLAYSDAYRAGAAPKARKKQRRRSYDDDD